MARLRLSPVRQAVRLLAHAAKRRGGAGGGGGGGANTWAGQRLLGINSTNPFSYSASAPYRNMRHQMRWAGAGFGAPPPMRSDGYPAAGAVTAVAVFLDSQIAGYEGTYKVSVAGNHIPSAINGGTASGFAYNAGTNKTTGNVVVTNSAQTLAIQWSSIAADFGALEIMQPGYNPGDTALLTTTFQAHLGRAKVLRCMDQERTNGDDGGPIDTVWTDSWAASESHALKYIGSVKGSLDVCAEIGADPWICASAAGDDNYLQQYASRALTLLPAGKKLTIGIGNEPFNTAGGFPSFPALMVGAIAAADAYAGYSQLGAARKIVSISRASNKITLVLGQNHSWNVGDTIYQSVDTAFCPAGTYTLVSGTAGANVCWNHTGSDGSGAISGWVDSYVYRVGTGNPLTAQLSGYGDSTMLYPHPLGISIHYQIQRLRVMYDQAVTMGKTADLALVRDTSFAQYPHEDTALWRARQQYGNLDWLEANGGGFCMNGYMIPANPNNLATANAIFTQLETARTGLNSDFIKKVNYLRRFGGLNKTPGRQRVYEWGQHIHNVPAGSGPAVQAANRDDARMGTLLGNLAADLRNRGAGVMCFFTSGSNANYALDDITYGAAWGLREGAMTNTSPQVKDTWFGNQGAASADLVAVNGVTWGNILFKDVLAPAGSSGTGDGVGGFNGDLYMVSTNDVEPDYYVQVYVDTAGTKTFAVDASAWFDTTGQTLTMFVNGTQIATGTLPQANPYAGYPPQAISGTANLAVGLHWVSLRVSGPGRQNNGLYRLRCS